MKISQFDDFLLQPEPQASGNDSRGVSGGESQRRIATGATLSLDGALSMNNSITMTPTTQFLEQPALFRVAKGAGPPLPPGAASASGGSKSAVPVLDDLLVDLHYASPHLIFTCAAGIAGFAIGAVLNKVGVSETAQIWIGFPGYFFISAIECLTLPLLFTSVSIGFANLTMSSKTRGVNVRVLGFFLGAAFLACVLALGVSFIFGATSLFAHKGEMAAPAASARLSLQCPNGKYLAANASTCVGKQLRDAMAFVATNITGVSLQVAGAPPRATTFAQQIVAFFDNVVTQNIAGSFASSAFLAATVFSMLFGAGLVLAHDSSTGEPNHVFVLLKQLDLVLELILNWLMPWTPVGTLSAMAFYVMQGTLTRATFDATLGLSLALLATLVTYFALVTCVGYWLLVRKNPLAFSLYLLPAMLFMFGSSNYTATIPVLMRCIEGSQQISRTLAQYIVSVGVSLCLPGTAAFFVVATVFMAYTAGMDAVLTPGRVIALVVVSTLGSFGVPHQAGASLTYVATIWLTLFPSPLPPSFALVMAIEWLTTRMRRTHNVLMVAVIARVIAEQLDETVEDEEDRAEDDRIVGLAHM